MRFSSFVVNFLAASAVYQTVSADLNCNEWRWSDSDGAVHRLIGTDDDDDCSTADGLNTILGSCPVSYTPIRCKPNTGLAWACSQGTANAINNAFVSLRKPNPNVKCVLGLLTGGPDCMATVETINVLVNEWTEDSTAFDGCRVTTTATSTASSTATTTAVTSVTTTATSTDTSREHYGKLTCSSLYGQQECLLSVRDAPTCADHANVMSELLAECGLPRNTISCAPVDGHFILIMTPLDPPTGTLSMGGVANISPGTVATFRLNPATFAYEYWETRPLLGEDTTVCTAISKILFDAVNGLYEWRGSTPQTPFGCTFVYLHGGIAKGGQYDSVDYLNELLDESREGHFPECKASTTTATSTVTTTATSSATTTVTTTVGRASMMCTKIYGINMLASDSGPMTCLEDAHYLHEIMTTCTSNATNIPTIGCYKSAAAVFVTTLRETCSDVAAALTEAFDGHALGGSIGCVPTGFVDEDGKLLSALRPPEDIAGGCQTTSDLLNKLIIGYMDYKSCAVPTVTSTTTTTFTTSTATVSTTVPLTPSLTLVFQADIAADQELGFSDAILEAFLSTGTVSATELVAVDLFGGSVIAVIGFKTMEAKMRAQNFVASSTTGLVIAVDGQTYSGVIFGATPKPTVVATTTVTTKTSTTTPDPAIACRQLSDEVFDQVPECKSVIERLTMTTTDSPITPPDRFNIDLEFPVAVSSITGNTILREGVRKQLGSYIAEYLAVPFTLESTSMSVTDKSNPNWVDPTGCTCFSSLIPYVLDKPDWAACPVSTTGVNSPASLGEYTLACASVEAPMQPSITGIDIIVPDVYRNLLQSAILECKFCPTLSVGTLQTMCPNLPGQDPCPSPSTAAGDNTGATGQTGNSTSTAVKAVPTQWTATAVGLMVGAALLFIGLGVVATYLLRNMPGDDDGTSAVQRSRSPAQEMRDLNILASKIRDVVSRSRPNTTSPQSAAAGGRRPMGVGGIANVSPQQSSGGVNPLTYSPAIKEVDGVEADGAVLELSKNGTKFPCLRGTFSPQKWANLENITMVLSDPLNGASQLQRDVRGKGVVVMRGGCSFVTKAKRMQDAGALCCVIVNTDHQVMPTIMQTATAEEMQIPIAIPTVLVRYLEGNAIINRLEKGLDVDATLSHRGWLTLQRRNANFVPMANHGEQIYKPASSMAPSMQGYLDVSKQPENLSQAPSLMSRPPLISPVSSPPQQQQQQQQQHQQQQQRNIPAVYLGTAELATAAAAGAPIYAPIPGLSAAENAAAAPVEVRAMVQDQLANLGFMKKNPVAAAAEGVGESAYASIPPVNQSAGSQPGTSLQDKQAAAAAKHAALAQKAKANAEARAAATAAAAAAPAPALTKMTSIGSDDGSNLSISSFASSDNDSFGNASEADGDFDAIAAEASFNMALAGNAASSPPSKSVTPLPYIPAKAPAPTPALRPHTADSAQERHKELAAKAKRDAKLKELTAKAKRDAEANAVAKGAPAAAGGFAVVKAKRPPPLDMGGSANAFAVVKRKAPPAAAPASAPAPAAAPVDNGGGDGAFAKPSTHYHPPTFGESVIAPGSGGGSNWWD